MVEFGGKAIEPVLCDAVVAGSVADDPRSIVQATDDGLHLLVRDGDGDFGVFFYHLAYPVNPGRWYVPGTELLRCCDSSSSKSLAHDSHRGSRVWCVLGQPTCIMREVVVGLSHLSLQGVWVFVYNSGGRLRLFFRRYCRHVKHMLKAYTSPVWQFTQASAGGESGSCVLGCLCVTPSHATGEGGRILPLTRW